LCLVVVCKTLIIILIDHCSDGNNLFWHLLIVYFLCFTLFQCF
jgi:hypothetical protein